MTWSTSILILTLGTTLCSSAILDNVADLNKLNLKFDFIVVGGKLCSTLFASVDTDFSYFIKVGMLEMSWQIAFQRIPNIQFWCLKQVDRKRPSRLDISALTVILHVEIPTFCLSLFPSSLLVRPRIHRRTGITRRYPRLL
jgi:hypothetical protein